MNREQARQIIIKTFEAPFNKGEFTKFIGNLLNRIDETKAFHARGYVKEAFKQVGKVIKTYERIGTYTDPRENKIDVLIVYLERKNSLERARTTMRNFVAKYLKDRGKKDAALIAFISPDKEDWRFSLVKMDYRFEDLPAETLVQTGGKAGRVKVKEEFTSARRWSFLVGKNEKSHTAQSRLVPILEDDEHNPTLTQLEETFNIETVTKEFFEKYRDLFIHTIDELDKTRGFNPLLHSEFETKNINTIDFAKKLLGQIVFLYFLQKKGWFGVKRDAEWGTGAKNFLRQLFEKEYGDYENFFNDILEPLFYEAIARERDDNFYSRFNCKIPFLNGGLFEPIGGYNWIHTDINLPGKLFSNNHRTPEGDIGDGILDVLDRFNFTVKEDEPLEKEVAIDPELLGKLYEKFNAIRPDNFYEYKRALLSGKKTLEKKFNKQYGVYYTPREIVHYMCQQSLINYLFTELNQGGVAYEKLGEKQLQAFRSIGKERQYELMIKHTSAPTVRKEDIETFVKYGEQFAENEAVVEEKGKETKTYKHKLPESIRENAKLIDEELSDIKVCDPAVGSGAFPVGMMAEIVKARDALSTYISNYEWNRKLQFPVSEGISIRKSSSVIASETKQSRTIYSFKRDCIEESLYGVDIDPGACEIAKLRLWLSLVVDEEEIKNIKPLPNLDYKIVRGNSLIGFPEGWGSPIEKEIESLKHDFFNETNPKEKNELRQKIDEKINYRYKSSPKYFGYKVNFDFRTVFSEVFHQKGGFDVVIANPPYVRQERIKDQKELLKKQGYKVDNSTSDLYTYFYERSYHILKPKGFSCFISSNKWMRVKYGEKLRRFFKENTNLKQIIDFNGYQVFDATVDADILLFQKIKPLENIVNILNIQPDFTPSTDITTYFNSHKLKIKQSELESNCFTFGDETILNLKKKIEKKGIPLKNWDVKIYRGVLTGFNKAFIIDTQTKERLCAEDPKSAEILKPILRGRDIYRYGYKWAGLCVIFIPWHFPLNNDTTISGASKKSEEELEKQYHAIFRHLSKYKYELSNRNKDETCIRYEWYALQRCAATYYPEFEKDKIVWAEIVREPSFAYDTKNIYCEATTFLMTGKGLKYLIAILNSKPVTFFFKQFYAGGGLGESGYRYKKAFLEQLPIPKISESDQKPFIDLVDKILSITKDNDYLENPSKQAKVKEYEHQIDQMVYKIYGLTDEEIKIIEGGK